MNVFIREILSSHEIEQLKENDDEFFENESIPNIEDIKQLLHKHQSFQIPKSMLKSIQEELKSSVSQQSQNNEIDRSNDNHFQSLIVPNDDSRKLVFKTAVDVASNTFYKQKYSEAEDEGESV